VGCDDDAGTHTNLSSKTVHENLVHRQYAIMPAGMISARYVSGPNARAAVIDVQANNATAPARYSHLTGVPTNLRSVPVGLVALLFYGTLAVIAAD
jgi:hypothetical protein